MCCLDAFPHPTLPVHTHIRTCVQPVCTLPAHVQAPLLLCWRATQAELQVQLAELRSLPRTPETRAALAGVRGELRQLGGGGGGWWPWSS